MLQWEYHNAVHTWIDNPCWTGKLRVNVQVTTYLEKWHCCSTESFVMTKETGKMVLAVRANRYPFLRPRLERWPETQQEFPAQHCHFHHFCYSAARIYHPLEGVYWPIQTCSMKYKHVSLNEHDFTPRIHSRKSAFQASKPPDLNLKAGTYSLPTKTSPDIGVSCGPSNWLQDGPGLPRPFWWNHLSQGGSHSWSHSKYLKKVIVVHILYLVSLQISYLSTFRISKKSRKQ